MGRETKDELMPDNSMPPVEETPAIPKNSVQLNLSEEMQKMIVDIVSDDYDCAKRGRDERTYGTTSRGIKLTFEKWKQELIDLYNAERIPKTVPWKFCSNRSLRIAKAILDMLHARLFPSICNENLLKFRAENMTSYPKLERIEKLMHWWLFVHCKVRQFYDDWTKTVLGFGDALTETTWVANPHDLGKTETKHVVGPDGQPVMEPDGTPSQVVSRIISLIESTKSTAFTRDKFFLQPGSTDIEREPVVIEKEMFYRDLEQGEAKGQFVNVSNLLKEKLPFSKEGLTNLPPEEQDRIKDIKVRNQNVKFLTWYGNFDADGDGFAEDVRVYISHDYKIYLGGVAMTNVTKSGKRPLDFTKLESRLENTQENFGYGILETVKELAEEVDALFNQMADDNTLAIMSPGFYDPGGDLDAPSMELSPNKMTPLSDPQRNIYIPPRQSNADKIIMAIRLVMEFIERLTAASSYVMGKESDSVGGSGTATRTNAIVQAANERFGMPAERLRQGASNIVRHHLDELQLNIPQGLEQRILGDDGVPIFAPNELSQLGIAGEFDAYLLSDPSLGSKELEQQVAQMLYSILMQNPIVASDPTKIYRVTAELIKPYGKDYKYYLGPEPLMDMIDDPAQENTLMLQGEFDKVQAQFSENHILHIQKHMELQQSPSLAMVPPALLQQVLEFDMQHIQQHMQMQQMIMKAMQKGGGPNGDKGNGEFGADKGGAGGNENSPKQPGMEQASGPLGSALESKRAGESGRNQGQQGT